MADPLFDSPHAKFRDEITSPAANLKAAIRHLTASRATLFQTPTTTDDREWPGRIVLEHEDGGRVILELPLPADVAGAIMQAAGEHELELAHTDAGNDRQQVVAQAKRITELEDALERRNADAADLKCALEEERERHADVDGPHEDDGEADGPDEDPAAQPEPAAQAKPDSYSITVHPHPRGGTPAGAWLMRCYTVSGEHVHSAEGGVSLDVGLGEIKRAIRAREAAAGRDR